MKPSLLIQCLGTLDRRLVVFGKRAVAAYPCFALCAGFGLLTGFRVHGLDFHTRQGGAQPGESLFFGGIKTRGGHRPRSLGHSKSANKYGIGQRLFHFFTNFGWLHREIGIH